MTTRTPSRPAARRPLLHRRYRGLREHRSLSGASASEQALDSISWMHSRYR